MSEDSSPGALDDDLRRLAEAHGVATEYWDWQGKHVTVPGTTIVAVLAALGVDTGTEASRAAARVQVENQAWLTMLPPCKVLEAGEQAAIDVHVWHGEPVDLLIVLEDGARRTGLVQMLNENPPRQIDGRLIGEATFALPTDLPLGYHTLQATSAGRTAMMPLIITPAWVGMPPQLGEGRAWGLATQLYQVRSQQSWGVGDLADLTDLAVWAGAEHGADYVLVNPLHAAEPTVPMEPSPYLPTSRRFTNPIYLRPERIPEFTALGADARASVDELLGDLRTQTDGLDRIDRNISWTAKLAALQLIHAAPRTPGREFAFRAYRRREGQGLLDYATWCVLAELHGALSTQWPAELRHPDSPAVAAARTEHWDRIGFHCWLQWVLDEQLAEAQSRARAAGMRIGVMHDLAVGVNNDGADAWALQDVLATGVAVGAPPDAYNQAGQTWAQPPWRPDKLAETGYAPFRRLVSTVLRHAGGIRADHIIGLFRLWWIPAGSAPTEGTYVRYDHTALIGILALEAHRNGAVVVGEDLGTVEPGARDYLRRRGILGTSILWFEYDYEGDGRPLAPEKWREYSMASVTTHDLPPTAGYLSGDHVKLRHDLGLLTRSLDEELDVDASERATWMSELHARGLLDDSTDTANGLRENASRDAAQVEAIVLALHKYLLRTSSRLLCVALTDAVGDRRTQNQPGTIDQYPNWRVPLTGANGENLRLEDVFASTRAARLLELFSSVGSHGGGPPD